MYIFSERLKEQRLEHSLSQKALADAAGVTQACIAYWEKGKKEPSARRLYDLAVIFKVSTDYLLGLTDY